MKALHIINYLTECVMTCYSFPPDVSTPLNGDVTSDNRFAGIKFADDWDRDERPRLPWRVAFVVIVGVSTFLWICLALFVHLLLGSVRI